MIKFIFLIKIKKGKTKKEYIQAWKRGSSLIQKLKGARGTMLYKNLDKPEELIAIANWTSKSAREKVMRKLKKTRTLTQKIINKHKDFGKTKVLGSFKEIARINSQKPIE